VVSLEKLAEPSTLLLIVLALTVGVLLFKTNRYFARQRSRFDADKIDPRRFGSRDEKRPLAYNEPPDDLTRWEVQMHDTARELTARLDTKMSAMRSLIAEADRAAARLESATQQACDPMLHPSRAEPAPEQAAAVDASPAADSTSRPRPREEIYTLADYGYDAAEIARRVGCPIGEVELILSLRGRS
jgi:hypothetical protein